ncbi:SRPBCC family protein [Nonomuraea sp. B12E4]|uniref:SRPBCC family protein n=1 Tax=Nonomuraea sp. B12E4 TaxID=3153564 RepID=UPI00325D50A4
MPTGKLEISAVPEAKAGMLIRRRPAEVFQAIVDPEITTKIWYTKSSGNMTPGAELLWEWEMYGASSRVVVKEVEENSRILFTWSGYTPDNPTTVEFRFISASGGTTYVQVTESGFTGSGDEVVQYAIDSTGGFTFLISGLKALLEHDLPLGLIGDAHPRTWQHEAGLRASPTPPSGA